MIYAGILQTNTIEHAHGSLSHAGIVVSLPGLEGCTFDHKSAQGVQIDEIGIFFSETECTRSRQDGIFKLKIFERC